MQMVCNLREFKEFIDNEMIVILGQMDSPTEIFEHVYLVRTVWFKEEKNPPWYNASRFTWFIIRFMFRKTTMSLLICFCSYSLLMFLYDEYISVHLDIDCTCDVSRALSGMPLTWRSCRTAGKRPVSH